MLTMLPFFVISALFTFASSQRSRFHERANQYRGVTDSRLHSADANQTQSRFLSDTTQRIYSSIKDSHADH